jgi:hypothetical protein
MAIRVAEVTCVQGQNDRQYECTGNVRPRGGSEPTTTTYDVRVDEDGENLVWELVSGAPEQQPERSGPQDDLLNADPADPATEYAVASFLQGVRGGWRRVLRCRSAIARA